MIVKGHSGIDPMNSWLCSLVSPDWDWSVTMLTPEIAIDSPARVRIRVLQGT